LARTHIVIADNHPEVLDEVCELLSPDYDIVATVANGQELIDSAAQLRPDVIVTDIRMPVMNGLQAAERLRQLGLSAKLVFLTVVAAPAYLKKARDLGARAYVLKIEDFEHLSEAVKAVIAGETYVSPQLKASGWNLDPYIH
jgi:DNA-binding NarL/FixJ family response regulator